MVAVHDDGGSWHSLSQITPLHVQFGLDLERVWTSHRAEKANRGQQGELWSLARTPGVWYWLAGEGAWWHQGGEVGGGRIMQV